MMHGHIPRSVQLIDNYFPVIDGVIQTVHHYAAYMDAAVVCPRMKQQNSRSYPYKVLTCSSFRPPFSQYACALPFLDCKLTQRIAQIHPEILHTHSPALLGRYALTAGKKLGIPVVATFHSKIYDAVREFTGSTAIARELTKNTVRFYEHCDAVWACSEGTADTLRSYGYRGDITVVTNGTGIDCPADPQKAAAEAAVRYGIPKDRHILLFVGQMVWYKNQKLMLDAYRLLCDETDTYCLVMVGAGRDDEAIRRYADLLGFTKNQILFTGKIENRDHLAGVYACADLLFFPSVFDNTPLVLREAASMKVPALLAAGSNAAEGIENDVNGFTAEAVPGAMRDAIRRIFSDPAGLALTGLAAGETIAIPWKELIPQVAEHYSEIIHRYRKHQ